MKSFLYFPDQFSDINMEYVFTEDTLDGNLYLFLQNINCFILAHSRGFKDSFEHDLFRKPIFDSCSGEKNSNRRDLQKT